MQKQKERNKKQLALVSRFYLYNKYKYKYFVRADRWPYSAGAYNYLYK